MPTIFESGIHPKSSAQNHTIDEEFKRGNLDIRIWNKELGTRIRNKPLLIIDSLVPTRRLTDEGVPSRIWLNLPSSPSEINPNTKFVYVVMGDALERYMFKPGILKKDSQDQMWSLTQKNIVDNDSQILLGTAQNIVVGGIGLQVASVLEAYLRHKQINRRRFLLNGVTALMLEGLYSISFLPTTALHTDKYQEYLIKLQNTILKPRFIDRVWVDGRTALLISKEQDARKELGMESETGVVVMGSAHFSEAQNLIDDPDYRASSIRKLANFMVNELTPIAEKEGMKKKELMEAVLNFLSLVRIVKVNEIDGPRINPDLPSLVQKAVQPVKYFKSNQVQAALKPLR